MNDRLYTNYESYQRSRLLEPYTVLPVDSNRLEATVLSVGNTSEFLAPKDRIGCPIDELHEQDVDEILKGMHLVDIHCGTVNGNIIVTAPVWFKQPIPTGIKISFKDMYVWFDEFKEQSIELQPRYIASFFSFIQPSGRAYREGFEGLSQKFVNTL